MGFSGGGSNITKPHTHDSNIVQDGGALAPNVTQFGLTAGSILYSDGSNIQELGVGSAGDSLVTNGAATAPEWSTSSNPHNAGMIIMWSGTFANIPSGWLLCDGASVATASYASLFSAIAYVYGGSGANFNLPDLVAKFPKGVATQTATTGGANSKTLAIGEIPAHTHAVTDPGHLHDIGGAYTGGSGSTPAFGVPITGALVSVSATTGISNANTGGGGSFDNQPAFLELQYIIKT